MQYKDLLTLLLERHDLPRDSMLAAMRALMSGEYTPVQIAGFLIALRMKGETVTEIAAAADVMRELRSRCRSQASIIWSTPAARVATARTPSIFRLLLRSLQQRVARAWPSTAGVRFHPPRAAPTCWKRWG